MESWLVESMPASNSKHPVTASARADIAGCMANVAEPVGQLTPH